MTYKPTTYNLDPSEHLEQIAIGNDGPRIASTNYWNLPIAMAGLCYLSGNAGDWRLLLPSLLEEAVEEFNSVRRALIEPSIVVAGHIDIVAVDGSDAPYCVTISRTMIDRLIIRKRCRLFVYTEKGLINNIPVKVLV